MVTSAEQSPRKVLPKPEVLRLNVMEQLQRMNAEQLSIVHDWLMQLELEQAVKELGSGLAEDEAAGNLSPEAIAASIREYRSRHPYGR